MGPVGLISIDNLPVNAISHSVRLKLVDAITRVEKNPTIKAAAAGLEVQLECTIVASAISRFVVINIGAEQLTRFCLTVVRESKWYIEST